MSDTFSPSLVATGAAIVAPPVSVDAIRAFYDAHLIDKVADFVDGNPRVEAAWATIERWGPPAPSAILEIGSGFGQISWRLAAHWPGARVTGLDLSARSIELAAKVFQRSNLAFVAGEIDAVDRGAGYDLIVLVDVYEHVALSQRPAVMAALQRLLTRTGRLILTFPSPAYQRLLRARYPERLQPVDEDVEIAALQDLATATGTRLVMYSEHSIWMPGDYAHAVLAQCGDPVARAPVVATPATERVVRKVRAWWRGADPESRAARLRLVEDALGPGVYRPR